MKKVLLLPFLIGFIFTSCEPVPEDLTTKVIYNFSINSKEWQVHTDAAGLNRYYSCSLPVSNLNSNVYDDGAVIAYIVMDGYQQVLPYIRHYENSNGERWTRTVDFDFSDGAVNFYITNSDFAVDPPGNMDFRVVLMW
ncbi:MAG TPA: hypothetical protein PKH58_06090 [Paludibacteraceae bacterium]|nr:hypothetical protein [Paludibacteraceae bacterium]HPT42579.1 hypothetical protein [Paludibacteraceae bacterium]